MCFSCPTEKVPHSKILDELVKLPYKNCWFEFKDASDNSIAGFWSREIINKNNQIDIQVILFAYIDSMGWGITGVYHIIKKLEKTAVVQRCGIVDDGVIDLFGMFATYLSVLNCCNIKRTEHKPEPSKQSVRRALGRQPLFSTWTLEIDLQRTESEMPGQGGTHASPRLHLRRGHARQHKPGLWCWVQPHVVGDKSLGMIHKDYASQ